MSGYKSSLAWIHSPFLTTHDAKIFSISSRGKKVFKVLRYEKTPSIQGPASRSIKLKHSIWVMSAKNKCKFISKNCRHCWLQLLIHAHWSERQSCAAITTQFQHFSGLKQQMFISCSYNTSSMESSAYQTHLETKANVGHILTLGFQDCSSRKRENCRIKHLQLNALAQKWCVSQWLTFHCPVLVTW